MKEYEETIKQAVTDGEIEEVFSLYKEAIDLEPERMAAYYNMALLYHQQGQLDEAIVNFEKAAELNPNDASVFNNLDVLYYSKDRLKKQKEISKKRLKSNLTTQKQFMDWKKSIKNRGKQKQSLLVAQEEVAQRFFKSP